MYKILPRSIINKKHDCSILYYFKKVVVCGIDCGNIKAYTVEFNT
jgi:hypothetical protein